MLGLWCCAAGGVLVLTFRFAGDDQDRPVCQVILSLERTVLGGETGLGGNVELAVTEEDLAAALGGVCDRMKVCFSK